MSKDILCIGDVHTFNSSIIENLNEVNNYYKGSLKCILLLGDINETLILRLKEIFIDTRILGVLGNHDYPYVYKENNIENINGMVINIDSVKIAGIEGSFKYKEGKFPSYTHIESLNLINEMEEADILISHTSPYGVHEKDNDVHSGLLGIREYIEKHKPKFNIHGHQHKDEISILNNTYIIGIYGISIIDIEKMTINKIV